MQTTNITKYIEDEVKRYEDTNLDVNPAYARRQKDIFDLIDLQWVSKFRDGNKDDLGFQKVFYNINNFPVEISAKMIDIDTKDIILIAEDWASYWPAWLMSKELKMWMKGRYFGRQLNEYCLQWPKYGHLIVKKVQDDVVIVPPQNIIVRTDADSLDETPIIEVHEYDEDTLLAIIEEKNWKKPSRIEVNSDNKAVVYEAFFPKGLSPEEDYNYFITNGESVLVQQKRSKNPYKGLAWENIPGRFFGRGVVEKLFESQIYLNRIGNYKSEGLHWTSKHLYQTRDTSIESNQLTEVPNGFIFKNTHPLEPVANEERNLSAYGSDEVKWLENAMKISFTREPISGGRAPSGTPLGSTILQQKAITDYFKQKKEILGSFIKEILWDWVIPEFKNQNRKEHKVLIENLISDENTAHQFFNLLLEDNFRKRQAAMARRGVMLDPAQRRIIKGLIAERLKGEEFKIPKGLYDNAKYLVDILITGEQLDVGARQTTYQAILQILGSNPTILQDKKTARIFNRMLDLAGLNPKDLGLEEDITSGIANVAGEAKATRGGSISSPPVSPTPQTVNVQTVI